MLPSKGKFALYACPYLQTGSCGRPYCQFNHSADSNKNSYSDAFAGTSQEADGPPSPVEKPIARDDFLKTDPLPLLAAIKAEPEEDDLIPQLEALFGMEGAPKVSFDGSETPTYEPTPISKLKTQPHKTTKTVSQYKPKEPSAPVKVEYTPKSSTEEYVPTASSKPAKVASYVPTKKSPEHKKSSSSSKSRDHKSSKSSSSSSKSKSESSHKSSSSSKSSSSKSSKSSSSKSHESRKRSSSSDKKADGKKHRTEKAGETKSRTDNADVIICSDNDDDDHYEPLTVMLDSDDDVVEETPKKEKAEKSLKRTNGTSKSSTQPQKDIRKSTDSESGTAAAEDATEAPADKKRRIAHSSKLNVLPTRLPKKVIRPVVSSVGQVLAERWKKQQELKFNEAEDKKSDDDLGTRVGCHPKGKLRVAHPSKSQDNGLPRPKITPSPSKVPAVKRQYVLDQLIDACLAIYSEQVDAFAKAVELETAILAKASTSNVYTSVFVSQKRLLCKCEMPPPLGTGLLSMAPAPTVRTIASCGAAGARIEKIDVVTRTVEVKGDFLHRLLSHYILSKPELKEHGFPLAHESEPNRAVVFVKDDRRKKMAKETQRECGRCGVIYSVDETGMPEKLSLDDLCIYHPKRTYRKRRDRTTVEDYYMCCDRPMSSEGCESNPYHVSENPHHDHLAGFVTTRRSSRQKHKTGVFALDCEMCITTDGTSCTRVTVIDEHRNNIYDALVKPDKPVLDYITRFSGITEELLNNGTAKSLQQVQRELLQIFRAESILIGHSLQGDLMVLKMIHKNVVDTSIVFPHREGLPKRRALKNLAKDYLMRLIQVEESGHDSSEDALACLDLMLIKARDDARSQ